MLKQDVLDSPVKKGDRGIIVDQLSPNSKKKEAGYMIEVFKNDETLDVISVPVSWVIPLSKFWGKEQATIKERIIELYKILYKRLNKS